MTFESRRDWKMFAGIICMPRIVFVLGLSLLFSGVAANAQEPTIRPDLVLAVTVEQGRAEDFDGQLSALLNSMGFTAAPRNQTALPSSPHRVPLIVRFRSAIGTVVHFDNLFGPDRFGVAIYAMRQDKTWRAVADGIIEKIGSLPYCRITETTWKQ